MPRPDRPFPYRASPRVRLLAALGAALLCCTAAPAGDKETPPLRLGGVIPGGARATATDGWGEYDFELANLTDVDRNARVLMFFPRQPDVRYGRDVWVPARSTVSTWMLVGPAPGKPSDDAQGPQPPVDIQILLYDRTDGKDRLLLPPGEERVRSRGVNYERREPYTAILLDEEHPDEFFFGRPPPPRSPNEEAIELARTLRSASGLSEYVHSFPPHSLPPAAEAFDAVDHVVLASGRVAQDPVGLRVLRQWLERGRRVWVMLDRVDPEAVAPLLGDAVDFELVDRVRLTGVRFDGPAAGAETPVQEFERPVEFARVLLPPRERPPLAVNGWPAWFTRKIGRGEVVFTTLGPRAWSRERKKADERSPFREFPNLPVALPPLAAVGRELVPATVEDLFPADVFRPLPGDEGGDPTARKAQAEARKPWEKLLGDEIGYSVVGRGLAALVFAAFLLAALALGLALRRSRRPEFLGWLCPAAALAAAGVFLALGESSRRASPPAVAVAEVIDAVPGTAEAPVRGLLAVYRPDSGPVDVGASRGGLFELDMKGLQGQSRSLMLTGVDSWRWDDVSLPAGVRFATFRATVPTGEPIRAVARFGPEGVEGRLAAGRFEGLEDAVLATPNGRNLAVRLGPDGAFRAGEADALPAGQFLAGAVLSDRQRRRQDLFRAALRPPADGRAVLLAWAKPIDLGFTPAPHGRLLGGALLAVPLTLEPPPPGERVTLPGPLVPYRRILPNGLPGAPTPSSNEPIDMHLRFQLPAAVLPFRVERARLTARLDAPGRRVTLAGRGGDAVVELKSVSSPLDPVEVEVADERFLRPDGDGGLHFDLSVGDAGAATEGERRDTRLKPEWTIEFVELEVAGRAAGD
jgi:hypothetical protein